MPHWRTMIEKDFLGSWDLTDPKTGRPRDWTLEVAKVASESLKTRETPKGKRRVVIRFKGAKKAFVANTTNCETIESMYGSDTDKWIGKRLTLYATMVRGPKGGQVPGIRVRPTEPTGPAETVPERDVDPAMRAAQDAEFDRGEGAS